MDKNKKISDIMDEISEELNKIPKYTNFKYIKSTQKDVNGKTIYSGQKVSVHGRINMRDIVEVYFQPDYGFRIQGNNFADAYDIKIENDITLINKIVGGLIFLWFNIFG